MKTFWAYKDIINERSPTEWEKIFANYTNRPNYTIDLIRY